MKKTLTIIALALLVFSCSNDSSSSSNDNKASGNVDYEFTISINGEVHKVKGNTVSGLPIGSNPAQFYNNNSCIVQNGGTFKLLSLGINDITANNYISGQNILVNIPLGNLQLGENKAAVNFQGQYFDDLSASLGGNNYGASYLIYQTTSGKANSESSNLLINITDVGTSSTVFQKYGKTLKGNYSGTIYLQRKNSTTYDIPVQLSIDFKAVRMY